MVENTSPSGTWLANTLRPLTTYPPSTLVAVPFGRVKSEPPVDTSTMLSFTTRRSIASAPGISRR